jgi:phosphoglycerate dehydrogenase-like enzyme
MTNASGTVALLEELSADHRMAFESTLPGGWRLVEGPTGLEQADVAVVRDAVIEAEAVASAERLRRVVQIELGRGSVDKDACKARGIEVELVPSLALTSVAEHAVMALLMLLKRFEEASARLRGGRVADGREPALTTQESFAYNWVGLERFEALGGQPIGLVGLGRIGLHAAMLLKAFGADVAYTKRARLDPATEQALRVRFLPFDELLASCRAVSVHARFDPADEPMFGAREFELMPRGAFFVNTARGRLVDEDALVAALESGQLGGAALDVFQYEPIVPTNPLLSLPNVLLTPHTGGIPTAESQLLELREAARRATS